MDSTTASPAGEHSAKSKEGGLFDKLDSKPAQLDSLDTAPDALFEALANGWAKRLRALRASERSLRSQDCITLALAFIADSWALEALRCGWSELELFAACPVAPWERLDRLGAAYSEGTAIAVTAAAIFYRSSGKEPLCLLRGSQADGVVLPWERAR